MFAIMAPSTPQPTGIAAPRLVWKDEAKRSGISVARLSGGRRVGIVWRSGFGGGGRGPRRMARTSVLIRAGFASGAVFVVALVVLAAFGGDATAGGVAALVEA